MFSNIRNNCSLTPVFKDVRKGFNKVTVKMQVKSKASVDELTECAMFSPVFEMLSKALPVEFTLTVC